ncbi:MAG: penicillin-binding protein activator [Pseudomonadales bacterium]|nr:penicillin-binding protein activator [Pseudomonadales bacterium]
MNFRRPINAQNPAGLRRTCIYILSIAWLVSSCTSQPKQPQSSSSTKLTSVTQQTAPTDQYSVTELLDLAEQSASPKMELYLLDAMTRLLQQNKLVEVQSLNARIIPETLPAQLKIRYELTIAELALANSEPAQALDRLAELERHSYSSIPLYEQIKIAQLRSQAYELQQNYLDSARQLIYIEPIIHDLGEQPYQQNNQAIWRALMNTSLEQLQAYLPRAQDTEIKGWLELAQISKNLDIGIDMQVNLLRAWQDKHPYHPLNKLLPEEIRVLSEIKQSPPQKIALLLPMRNQLSGAGKAVLNGFMSALYHSLALGNNQPVVRIYDTSESGDVATLYWQAIEQGAELVIGPLKQEHVEQLANIDLPVPVLSLNYIRNSASKSDNLYQFGLASEDSARMAAQQAWVAEKTNVIIIHPVDEWGLRNATAFSDEFTRLGGKVIATHPFNTPKQYAKIIQQTLHVSNSNTRIRQVSRVLAKSPITQTRRRQDTDLIFLVALPSQGRQIKPLLNYYYADDLPVYSISNIYSGEPNKTKDVDLDGIVFNETPWLAEDHGAIKMKIQTNWPQSYSSYPRLYALGADAFRIYPRLKQLELLPLNGMYAYTGNLKLSETGTIERSLKPVMFKSGLVKPLPPIASPQADAQ